MTKIFFLHELKHHGQLAITPRPRGDDWLEDEIISFRTQGIDIVVSALIASENSELHLEREEYYCTLHGIRYLSYPIEDRNVPGSHHSFTPLVDRLTLELVRGQNILIHCRQGIGRSSLIAAALLSRIHQRPVREIFDDITRCRGTSVPDTQEQIVWLEKWSCLSCRVDEIHHLFQKST